MDIIGTNVAEEKPNYILYLYKQFARDLQSRVVKYLYNSKVYVEANSDTDSAKVTITNKISGLTFEATVNDVMQQIGTEAEGVNQLKDIAKAVVGEYREFIWHIHFFDFKKRKAEEVTE